MGTDFRKETIYVDGNKRSMPKKSRVKKTRPEEISNSAPPYRLPSFEKLTAKSDMPPNDTAESWYKKGMHSMRLLIQKDIDNHYSRYSCGFSSLLPFGDQFYKRALNSEKIKPERNCSTCKKRRVKRGGDGSCDKQYHKKCSPFKLWVQD